jgi:hypothetical protein
MVSKRFLAEIVQSVNGYAYTNEPKEVLKSIRFEKTYMISL